MRDYLQHDTLLTVIRYTDEEAYVRNEPYDVSQHRGNLITSGGVTLLWQLATGGAGTAFSSANAYIGIGDSSTAALSGQTDLQAATNKGRWAMLAGSPGITGNQVSFSAKVPSADGNFAWNEFGIFNASAAGTMFNRVVSAQGTKSAGQVWVALVTITLA